MKIHQLVLLLAASFLPVEANAAERDEVIETIRLPGGPPAPDHARAESAVERIRGELGEDVVRSLRAVDWRTEGGQWPHEFLPAAVCEAVDALDAATRDDLSRYLLVERVADPDTVCLALAEFLVCPADEYCDRMMPIRVASGDLDRLAPVPASPPCVEPIGEPEARDRDEAGLDWFRGGSEWLAECREGGAVVVWHYDHYAGWTPLSAPRTGNLFRPRETRAYMSYREAADRCRDDIGRLLDGALRDAAFTGGREQLLDELLRLLPAVIRAPLETTARQLPPIAEDAPDSQSIPGVMDHFNAAMRAGRLCLLEGLEVEGDLVAHGLDVRLGRRDIDLRALFPPNDAWLGPQEDARLIVALVARLQQTEPAGTEEP